ncbi:MAG: hypothetical protein M3141_00160 [Actinomycetota bacterium]|nr:hypothetical protein [Actinomycetota bacterium]
MIKRVITMRAVVAGLAGVLIFGVAPSVAHGNPYWFSWDSADCRGTSIDPVSTYFTGPAAKGGRVRTSLVVHLGRLDRRWYDHTDESHGQYFRHYNGDCIEGNISVANGGSSEERMHIRGVQVASPARQKIFQTGLTPHYEIIACGGHKVAYAGALTRDGGRVRNGGYVYARIKVMQAFGNGKRLAFPFDWGRRPDARRRRECRWTLHDGSTVVHILYGYPIR